MEDTDLSFSIPAPTIDVNNYPVETEMPISMTNLQYEEISTPVILETNSSTPQVELTDSATSTDISTIVTNSSEVTSEPPTKKESSSSKESKKEEIDLDKEGFRTPPEFFNEVLDGIKFDFCFGLRIVSSKTSKTYRIVIMDDASGTILCDQLLEPDKTIATIKKYYIKYSFEIFDKDTNESLYKHVLDLTNQKVLVEFPVSTIGDTIGWFSYMERFKEQYKCDLYVSMQTRFNELFEKQYPKIHFIHCNEILKQKFYAAYYIGLFFKKDKDMQPVDFRQVGLHRTCGTILGLTRWREDIPPRADLSAERIRKKPYVVISVQGSSPAKQWTNPLGWMTIVNMLKKAKYDIVCIDRDPIYALNGCGYRNAIPNGCIDDTGNKPLQERINMIKDADFFIGCSTGLTWLAWCCDVPIVLISGFCEEFSDFTTPYRVINYNACHGCWNDQTVNFDHNDAMWCPFHKGTDRAFECNSMISPRAVFKAISNIPIFKEHIRRRRIKLEDLYV